MLGKYVKLFVRLITKSTVYNYFLNRYLLRRKSATPLSAIFIEFRMIFWSKHPVNLLNGQHDVSDSDIFSIAVFLRSPVKYWASAISPDSIFPSITLRSESGSKNDSIFPIFNVSGSTVTRANPNKLMIWPFPSLPWNLPVNWPQWRQVKVTCGGPLITLSSSQWKPFVKASRKIWCDASKSLRRQSENWLENKVDIYSNIFILTEMNFFTYLLWRYFGALNAD